MMVTDRFTSRLLSTQNGGHFSKLIERASLGEEITATKDSRPVARIVPLRPRKRQPGTGKEKITFIAPDFDAPLEDLADYQ